MSKSGKRPPSPSGVIEEIAALYPELSLDAIRRLVSSSSSKPPPSTNDGIAGKQSTATRNIDGKKMTEEIVENIEYILTEPLEPQVFDISDSSSSEDEFEFDLKARIEAKRKPKIVKTSAVVVKKPIPPIPSGGRQRVLDEYLQFRTPPPLKVGRMKTFRTPGSSDKTSSNSLYENDFLASLSEIFVGGTRMEACVPYLKNFNRRKDELIAKLCKIFNENVFTKRLPDDLPCTWNVRLTKTAGLCSYKLDENSRPIAHIELSTKVCDNAERIRDTLIHEMCHAAAWIVHRSKGGHDSAWKYWARQANLIFPALPTIRRCHAYQIHAKYLYTCTRCGRQVRRHSKSLDLDKKICGICHGRFELVENSSKVTTTAAGTMPSSSTGASGFATSTPKPRATPKFALFVQCNYSEIKAKTPHATHGEIMRTLGDTFKQSLDFTDCPSSTTKEV